MKKLISGRYVERKKNNMKNGVKVNPESSIAHDVGSKVIIASRLYWPPINHRFPWYNTWHPLDTRYPARSKYGFDAVFYRPYPWVPTFVRQIWEYGNFGPGNLYSLSYPRNQNYQKINYYRQSKFDNQNYISLII